MANKKYPTVASAMKLEEGQYVRDLTADDLRMRLQTLSPVVWKRVATIKKSGLTPIADLPQVSYRNKTRSELEHIFWQQREFIQNRETGSVTGIKNIMRETAKNLGMSFKSYRELDEEQIGKIFEVFHKVQELRPEWFTGKYSASYLKKVRLAVLKHGEDDPGEIVKKLQKVYDKEQGKDSKLYGSEQFTSVR